MGNLCRSAQTLHSAPKDSPSCVWRFMNIHCVMSQGTYIKFAPLMEYLWADNQVFILYWHLLLMSNCRKKKKTAITMITRCNTWAGGSTGCRERGLYILCVRLLWKDSYAERDQLRKKPYKDIRRPAGLSLLSLESALWIKPFLFPWFRLSKNQCLRK